MEELDGFDGDSCRQPVANLELNTTHVEKSEERSTQAWQSKLDHAAAWDGRHSLYEAEPASRSAGQLPSEDTLEHMIAEFTSVFDVDGSDVAVHDLAYLSRLHVALRHGALDALCALAQCEGLQDALRVHHEHLKRFVSSLVEGDHFEYMELFAGCGGRAMGYDISNEHTVTRDLVL